MYRNSFCFLRFELEAPIYRASLNSVARVSQQICAQREVTAKNGCDIWILAAVDHDAPTIAEGLLCPNVNRYSTQDIIVLPRFEYIL